MSSPWRSAVAVIAVAALVNLSLPLGAGIAFASSPKQAATIEVKMVEFQFQPKTVTISVGQAVSWTNSGSVTHTTTSEQQSGNPNAIWDVTVQPSFTFERVFNTAGTFNYYCKFHRDQGMTGQVIVQSTTTATPTGSPSPTPTGSLTPSPTGTPPTPTATSGTPTGQPQFFITSPNEGQVVTTCELPVRIETSNITLRPTGPPNRPGEGHFALFLDNLAEVQTAEKTYTFPNVAPGNHTLRVELRQNDNQPFTPPLQATVNFRSSCGLQPTASPPTVPTGIATGIATIIGPTATIGLPKTGDGTFPGSGPGDRSWLLYAAPVFIFALLLLRRARRHGT